MTISSIRHRGFWKSNSVLARRYLAGSFPSEATCIALGEVCSYPGAVFWLWVSHFTFVYMMYIDLYLFMYWYNKGLLIIRMWIWEQWGCCQWVPRVSRHEKFIFRQYSTNLNCFGNLRMEERFPELKNDVLRYEKPFFERRKPFLQTTSVPFLVVLGAVLVRS